MYDRCVSCTGQEEGGDSDAVFNLENGASLSNCIISPNQIEVVHCEGPWSLTNVWWSAFCEDAFTIKERDADETTTIVGGGAFGAEDKLLQHNVRLIGLLEYVEILTGVNRAEAYSLFPASPSTSLERSTVAAAIATICMNERHVVMDDVTASGGSEIAGRVLSSLLLLLVADRTEGINSNHGATASITNIRVSSTISASLTPAMTVVMSQRTTDRDQANTASILSRRIGVLAHWQ